MKKILVICLIAIFSTAAASAAPVNEKVLKVFASSFPEVQQTTWYNYDTYYSVYFKNADDTKCRIDYDLQGNIMSTTRYYSAEDLSPFIRGKVNEKYPGKKIFGVTEVSSTSEMTYHIVLEDEKNWYNIKSDATGSISLEKKMNKYEK
ncbi:MAG: hypothetical protein ABI691_18170 [Ginsengibacter sp.]